MNYEAIPKLEKKLHEWDLPIDFAQKSELLENDLTVERIKEIIKNPESYLGMGGVGKAYDLGNQCIKLIINRHGKKNSHMYDLKNDVAEEFEIQKQLNGFNFNGVFSPVAVGYYAGHETHAIVMEKLDAVNMQLVLNGSEQLPANFDLVDFFWRLEGYIDAMHREFGILHLDLEPRNIMIDRKTGYPRVIDFGRSSRFEEKNEAFERQTDKDFDKITAAYGLMEAYLDKKKKA